MMNPKIISIGYSVPKYSYDQATIFRDLAYPRPFWRIFRDAGIDKRYFCLPLEQIKSLSFQEQQEYYLNLAPILSYQAMENCLDDRNPQDIGAVIYVTCTGFPPGPTIAHYIGKKLKLPPGVFYTNISSQGCEGAFPGLCRAYDRTIASGKPSLFINCELTGLTYWPEPAGKPDPENDYEVLRANAIFGDAASACLVGYDDDWHHPEVIDMETHTNFDYIDELGYVWRNGRLRVKLSKRVPSLASLVVKPALDAVLTRQHLTVSDITWWIIHAAGNTVLDNMRDAIGVPEDKTLLSRETLRLYGNTSSASVGITSKRLMQQEIKRGEYVAVLSVGPGMTGGMTLCRFGG